MRILYYSYAYPHPWQPRLASFNYTMLKGLAQRHHVHVIAPVPFMQKWFRRRSVPSDSDIPAQFPTYYYLPKLGRPWYHHWLDWSTREVLQQTLLTFDPHVVLSYWTHPDGAVAARYAHQRRIPFAQFVGGSDVLQLTRDPGRRRIIARVLQAAEGVLTVSEHLAQQIADLGVPAWRVHVVRRGVDRRRFYPGESQEARAILGLPTVCRLGGPLLLGVGRLVPVKGWFDWLQACWELKQQGFPFQAYIVGDGPQRRALARWIGAHDMTQQVHLVGEQSQEKLVWWYRAADLTVLASHSEGVPNVLLETMACGRRFVATAVGGIPEIADPIWDRLVSPHDPPALAAAIRDCWHQGESPETPRRWYPDDLPTASERLERVLEAVASCRTRPGHGGTPHRDMHRSLPAFTPNTSSAETVLA